MFRKLFRLFFPKPLIGHEVVFVYPVRNKNYAYHYVYIDVIMKGTVIAQEGTTYVVQTQERKEPYSVTYFSNNIMSTKAPTL